MPTTVGRTTCASHVGSLPHAPFQFGQPIVCNGLPLGPGAAHWGTRRGIGASAERSVATRGTITEQFIEFTRGGRLR